MFKSGKQVKMSGKKIESNNSIIVAPKISIHGLLLSSLQPIPKEVMEFFTNKGAKIQIIEEDGDHLLRLSGQYTISHQEINNLLQKHKDIIIKDSADSKDSKDSTEARNFQNQLNVRLKNLIKSYEIGALKLSLMRGTAQALSVQPKPIANSVGSINLESAQGISFGASIVFAPESIGLKSAGKFESVGPHASVHKVVNNENDEPEVEETDAGVLSEITSGENITIDANKCIIGDSIVRASGEIIVNAINNIQLSQSTDVVFINSPETPSLTFSYSSVSSDSKALPPSDSTAGNTTKQKSSSLEA